MKRVFDIVTSSMGLIILSPLLLVCILLICLDSHGGAFFKQKRVGRYNRDFVLYKFRSMRSQAWAKGQLITVGEEDPRITRIGRFIRRYKIDELPQLYNVLRGDMSIVGPRPLVRQQVELYPEDYMPILSVRPGITSNASIYFRNESKILGMVDHPERYFKEVIMPQKIKLNKEYVANQSFWNDMRLIGHTLFPCRAEEAPLPPAEDMPEGVRLKRDLAAN